jgi:hypothetical protein
VVKEMVVLVAPQVQVVEVLVVFQERVAHPIQAVVVVLQQAVVVQDL